jgi:RNA polymerase sigma-70 factor, ECF subfamily
MELREPADEVLVARARRGDAAAFECLVRRYGRAVYAVARAVLGNSADAEDVSQESWVRALAKLEDCREPKRFVYWLLQIVRNRALSYVEYRRLRRTEPLESALALPGSAHPEDPGARLQRERQRRRLEEALAQLSAPQREILLLHDLVGWKHRRIAESLGISEVNCRQRLFQAHARMRELLGENIEGVSHE